MKRILILLVSYVMCLVPCVFAQENNKLVTLSKQIIEAKTSLDLYEPFAELAKIYYTENKYSDFTEYLKSLQGKKKGLEPFTNYYIAEARYFQLKYLQESQGWDEYFNKGNDYRNEITEGALGAITAASIKEPLNIYARLLLWRFHKDQEDALKDAALDSLMQGLAEYSKEAADIQVIKDAAQALSGYGEKGKSRELYKIYADKLLASDIKDEQLRDIASDFYKKDNLELSESLFDVYIERITKSLPKEKLVPELTALAKQFAWKEEGPSDPSYAEKLFSQLEEIAGGEAFDEGLMYLRAFNLEKTKDFLPAAVAYIKLLGDYPKTEYSDEANFKIGIISTYVERDIAKGRSYFEKLADKNTLSPQVISSIYQLGLLAQWQENFDKAKEYYNTALTKAGEDFQETVTLAKERLKEIKEAKPIEYNLKTFLDVSLKDEYLVYEMTRLDLKAAPYKTRIEKSVGISSHPIVGESGCFQVEVQYLWSGHLGRALPGLEEAQFATEYIHSGSKEVNLVVVTPSGILDRDLVMADIN